MDRVTAHWWAYEAEFPRWYVWRGVGGQYYARVPGCSPPRVVRAPGPEELRAEILRDAASRGQVPFQSELDRIYA